MSEHCIYYQTLCKKDGNSFGCHGKHYTNCKVYQEINNALVELNESGKLEEVLEQEYDIGYLIGERR